MDRDYGATSAKAREMAQLDSALLLGALGILDSLRVRWDSNLFRSSFRIPIGLGFTGKPDLLDSSKSGECSFGRRKYRETLSFAGGRYGTIKENPRFV